LFVPNRNVPGEVIAKLLTAASKAPSGKNGQPWRFRVLADESVQTVAAMLPNNKWLQNVVQMIAVFMDTANVYDIEKDTMAIGACVENMILEATANGVQSCWIGECSNYKDEICEILGVEKRYSLMALVAIGYGKKLSQAKRLDINDLMI
jgi:nitroreductase